MNHLRNRLEAESTRALLCLGEWSKLNIVDSKDLRKTAELPDVGINEGELEDGWDRIIL